MAKKKKVSKKTAPAPEPEVTSTLAEESVPGVVEEAFIKVCGAGMGGYKMMTQSEYDEYRKGK